MAVSAPVEADLGIPEPIAIYHMGGQTDQGQRVSSRWHRKPFHPSLVL